MLKCREVAEMANDYIDKELPWHKSMTMGLHLSMCRHCSGFVNKLRFVVTLVRDQPPEMLGDKEAEDIIKNISQASSDDHNKK